MDPETSTFRLHLGIYWNNPNNIDTNDCVCDEFFVNFKRVSKKNTAIYDDCFKCIPSDNIKSLNDLRSYLANPNSLSKTDPKKVI